MNTSEHKPETTFSNLALRKDFGEIVEKIKDIVNANPGIKATELVTKLEPHNKKDAPIPLILDEMVRVDMLVELEYILPNMNYRIKSMYFPRGTIFT